MSDVFGGVGCGGIAAAYRGLIWVGMELEPKFVDLAKANFTLHKSKWKGCGRGEAIMLQGDSHRFHEAMQNPSAWRTAGVVSSPPYAESVHDGNGIDPDKLTGNPAGKNSQAHAEGYGRSSGQIGRLKSGEVEAVIASPPFAGTSGQGGGGINVNGYVAAPGRKYTTKAVDKVGERTYQGQGADRTAGNIETLKEGSVEAVVSSPPFRDARSDTTKSEPTKHGGPCADRHATTQAGAGYGKADGQIDNLPTGDVHAIISSPPYSDIAAGAGGLNTKPATKPGQQSGRSAAAASQDTDQKYGKTAGQIAALKGGSVDSVVASPPFEKVQAFHDKKFSDEWGPKQSRTVEPMGYGDAAGQIGKENGETYWGAVKKVYESCFLAIKPGGVIVLVVKSYVKAGKIVDLPGDTSRLLEHIGFEPIEQIHAMLKVKTTHNDLFVKEGVTTVRSKASFFRRLAEKKGSPPIDFEVVLICRKPVAIAESGSPATEPQRGATRARPDSDMSNGSDDHPKS